MDAAELRTVLKSTGLPVAYRRFKQAKTPPYILFYLEGTDNFAADNVVYETCESYLIELYSKDRDLVSEGKLEDALDAAEIVWDKDETFIESENIVMMVYSIQI